MSTALSDYLATSARAIRGLLGDDWEVREGRFVASDRVTLDLANSAIAFRSHNGETDSVVVSGGTTLGTYATLCRALHGMTEDSARTELARLSTALRIVAGQINDWEREHNKP